MIYFYSIMRYFYLDADSILFYSEFNNDSL